MMCITRVYTACICIRARAKGDGAVVYVRVALRVSMRALERKGNDVRKRRHLSRRERCNAP